jgi:predicted PurR-regulated permease PerM
MPFPDLSVPKTDAETTDLPEKPEDEFPLPKDPITALLALLAIFAALAAAYVAADVVLPILLAIVLKFLLQPLMRFFSRLRIPPVVSAILLIFAAFSAIVGIGIIISRPAADWLARIPERVPQVEEKLHFLGVAVTKISSVLGQAEPGKPLEAQINAELANLGLASAIFRGTRYVAGELFETILVLFFLLISGDIFLRRLVEIMPRFKDKRQVVDLSLQIEDNVSAYLATITLINAAVGIATGTIMWACGVGDPILWGVIAFLLNFVPIMGPLLGIGIFLFQGLLVMPNLWRAVLPAILYLTVHIIEGETITPMLLARRFTLNPVVVVVSLIFWFWMWGVPGAILSVPMLAITKIVCDGTKPLNAIGHFLEGD